MTSTTTGPVDHPLASVTADEIAAVREIIAAAGLITDSTRFVYVGLEVGPTGVPVSDIDRRFRVLLHDITVVAPKDVVVSVTRRQVDSLVDLDARVDGHLPVLDEEFALVEEVLSTHPQWLSALDARGLYVADVRVAPLSAGVFEYEEEKGRRILRGLGFRQDHPDDHAWAHPIDGLVAYVDVVNRTVDQILDLGPVPVPEESGNLNLDGEFGPQRSTQKPIEITQPEGPSFTIDGNRLHLGEMVAASGLRRP